MNIENIELFTDNLNIRQWSFNICHPVGDVYIQYPKEKEPNELYNNSYISSEWEELDYNGAFFRASGGDADLFIEEDEELVKQNYQNSYHSHLCLPLEGLSTSQNVSLTGTAGSNGSGHNHTFRATIHDNDDTSNSYPVLATDNYIGSYEVHGGTHSHSVYVTGCKHNHTMDSEGNDTESRPDNLTIKIWKRIA